MKAYALHGVGDLRYEDWVYPACPPGWAVVRVMAAGICSSDIPRIYTKGTYHFPTVPGHEFSGVIDSVGDRKDDGWVGRRVSVFPLIPCRTCPQCVLGHYETCEHYDYLGSRRDGGFAEYVAVPVWNLLEAPDTLAFSTLALFEPLAVALHAVKRAGSLSGRSVAVVGTGMIGLSAAYWARERGAERVFVMGRGEGKRKLVERLEGIGYCCDAAQAGADIVIEAVGTSQAIETALLLAAPSGDVVLMGNPGGNVQLRQDVYWAILRKQLHLCGTWNSRYDGLAPSDWTLVGQAAAEGRLPTACMITHRFSQEHLPEALELVRRHDRPYCKVMTLWNGCDEG